MSDQYPTSPPPPSYTPAPPPESYAPAPPAESYGPSGYGQPPAAPVPPVPGAPKKNKTALIVIIVVAVLLLCCCAPTCVGAIMFNESGQDITDINDISDITDNFTDGTDGTDGSTNSAQMDEWLNWNPTYTGTTLDAAPSSKTSMVEESVPIAAPGFSATNDIVWYEGYYSADEEWYYSDTFLVRATHPSSDQVSAALWIYIQSDLMIEDDIPFYVESPDVSTYLSNGTEMLYTPLYSSDGYFDITADDNEALWAQIGEDWPGAVVIDIYSTYGDATAYTLDITTWDAYAIEESSPYFEVYYILDDSGNWTVESYYEYAAGE